MEDIIEKINKNRRNVVFIIIITTFLICINYNKFVEQTSINPAYIVNYKKNIDELQTYRVPKIAALLYSKNNLSQPKIIISPKEKYLDFLYKKFANNNKDIQAFVLDPVKEKEQIVAIAKANNLIPKTIELNSDNLDNLDIVHNKDNHEKNIKDFIFDNKIHLKDLRIRAFSANKEPFKVTKKVFPISMFDKGNSFVFDKDIAIGSLNADLGIAQDIANNIFEAKKQGINLNSAKVVILTEPKEIQYNSQEELFDKIDPNSDGIVLLDGFRQVVFLPHMWNEYKTKSQFINQLKLKANLLPSYTSNSIKFYKFKVIYI